MQAINTNMGSHKTKPRFCQNKRRNEIAKYYLKGFTQCEIADKIGVSQFTVSKDIAVVHKKWIAEQITDRGLYVQRELEKISLLESSAWLEFEKSKEKRERVSKKSGTGKNGKYQEAGITSEILCGDPRYMVIVGNCIAQRCKILGLEQAPKASGLDPAEIVRRMAPVLAEEFGAAGIDRVVALAILQKLDRLFDLGAAPAAPVALIEAAREEEDVTDVEVETESDVPDETEK